MSTKKPRKIVLYDELPVVEELERRARAADRSVSAEVRIAVRRHLNPQAYDDLAAVLEAAAERIRREQGAA